MEDDWSVSDEEHYQKKLLDWERRRNQIKKQIEVIFDKLKNKEIKK
jgi:hypothetical protein